MCQIRGGGETLTSRTSNPHNQPQHERGGIYTESRRGKQVAFADKEKKVAKMRKYGELKKLAEILRNGT